MKTSNTMDEKHELIVQLLNSKDEKHDAQIKAILKSQETGFDTLAKEMREIKAQKIEQNGRITKLERITLVGFGKWLDFHPKLSIFIGLVAYLGLKTLFTFVSIEDLFKKYLP